MDTKAVDKARIEKAQEWLLRYVNSLRGPAEHIRAEFLFVDDRAEWYNIPLPEMLAAHEEHVLAQRWVSVEEREPPNCNVLVISRRLRAASMAIFCPQDGFWYEHGYRVKKSEFTHWQPLPEPPKDAKWTTNQKVRCECLCHENPAMMHCFPCCSAPFDEQGRGMTDPIDESAFRSIGGRGESAEQDQIWTDAQKYQIIAAELDSTRNELSNLRKRLEGIEHPTIYSGEYYASVITPELCPNCDGNSFISAGSKAMVCHTCWILHENDKLVAERDRLAESHRELLTALRQISAHGLHSGVISCPQDHSFYIEPMRQLAKSAISKAEEIAKK